MLIVQCVAMNRSLTNVLFGGIAAPQQAQKQIEGKITTATVDDVSEALTNAENVVIVCLPTHP